MPQKIRGRTMNEQLLEIRDLYKASGEPWPPTAKMLAIWAINKGHYEAHKSKIVAKAAEEFATAMRDEHYTDESGRRVRLMHASKIIMKNPDGTREQKVFWDDIRTAPPKFMERSFQQRRRQIVGDCRQLKNDVDSYNDSHDGQKPIQLLLDFRDDMAELEQPTEYRPAQPR